MSKQKPVLKILRIHAIVFAEGIDIRHECQVQSPRVIMKNCYQLKLLPLIENSSTLRVTF